eukprot:4042104-Pleurochrysis_carterae.AAC.1
MENADLLSRYQVTRRTHPLTRRISKTHTRASPQAPPSEVNVQMVPLMQPRCFSEMKMPPFIQLSPFLHPHCYVSLCWKMARSRLPLPLAPKLDQRARDLQECSCLSHELSSQLVCA